MRRHKMLVNEILHTSGVEGPTIDDELRYAERRDCHTVEVRRASPPELKQAPRTQGWLIVHILRIPWPHNQATKEEG